MHVNSAYASVFLVVVTCMSASGREAEPWESQYSGEDANGPHVIAYWNCDGEGDIVADVSGKGHEGIPQGVVRRPDGKFGGALESFPGWPVEDVCHRLQVKSSRDLSPRSAFTIEMWICPTEAFDKYEEAFIVDKKYVADTDYQWVLERPDSLGHRTMRVCLGFGNDSATWWSERPADFSAAVWSHIAFSYDGAGEVQFFQNGHTLGRERQQGRGSICPGDHFLSLGDRVGSYHHGFPGRMDEIRITEGTREFRPLCIEAAYVRSVFRRGEAAPVLQFRVTNVRGEIVTGVTVSISIAGGEKKDYEVPPLEAGTSQLLEYTLNTRLRPDVYDVVVDCRMGGESVPWSDTEVFEVTIVPRRASPRMPVVMWGVGGVDGVLENMASLKDIGFTHCLGLNCDYERIWDAKTAVPAVEGKVLAASQKMLDQALANDIGVIISLGVGHWLEDKTGLLRIDRAGKPYERENICCNFPELVPFAYNVGAAVAQTFGDFPAFEAALINTEVRDGSQLCFHEHDRTAYRAISGEEIPDVATGKSGVRYADIEGFPASRVVPDNDPLLQFYRWYWREGDGWNGFHSAVNNGLKSTGRKGLWTFFDPAVRVPPLWGSGGNVDFLSHWTYSYPDPIRIGLATDELLAMAQGGPDGQDVMKMTQVIWYRSQTAPTDAGKAAGGAASPWEDRDPDAAYITIAPVHLREAFWTKIARPIKGIMYHGWQSLVKTEGGGAYRFTHPDTRDALKELVATVVRPLGPTLLQVSETPTDVAFLESFTSSMFAGRGTYGWGGSWAGDAYHTLLYAHLQPRIVYEETIVKSGLDGYRVLVLADCDVLPVPVVERIEAFQKTGGIVVGDERLCPAITPDLRLESYSRTGKADTDKTALLERARTFREQIDARYERYLDTSLPEIIPYRRSFGDSDYVFLANDCREYGDYVGSYGLVMENGLPANGRLAVRRSNGCAYDLVTHQEVEVERDGVFLEIPIDLEPGGGRVWLITEKPISRVVVTGPEDVAREIDVNLSVSVEDVTGTPVNAVVPVELVIQDPNGRPAEFSGFYGAVNGRLSVSIMIGPNDTPGVWTVSARELASGKMTRHYFRVAS